MVDVELEYLPPGGVVGAGVARMLGEEPDGQVKDDLRRFKQIMEIGEILKSDGSPGGTGDVVQRPAGVQSSASPISTRSGASGFTSFVLQ